MTAFGEDASSAAVVATVPEAEEEEEALLALAAPTEDEGDLMEGVVEAGALLLPVDVVGSGLSAAEDEAAVELEFEMGAFADD